MVTLGVVVTLGLAVLALPVAVRKLALRAEVALRVVQPYHQTTHLAGPIHGTPSALAEASSFALSGVDECLRQWLLTRCVRTYYKPAIYFYRPLTGSDARDQGAEHGYQSTRG